MTKRILLEYTTGAYKGLKQILGTDDELHEKMGRVTLPDFLPEVEFLDHTAAVNLVKVTPRYVLYREVIVPALSGYAPKTGFPERM